MNDDGADRNDSLSDTKSRVTTYESPYPHLESTLKAIADPILLPYLRSRDCVDSASENFCAYDQTFCGSSSDIDSRSLQVSNQNKSTYLTSTKQASNSCSKTNYDANALRTEALLSACSTTLLAVLFPLKSILYRYSRSPKQSVANLPSQDVERNLSQIFKTVGNTRSSSVDTHTSNSDLHMNDETTMVDFVQSITPRTSHQSYSSASPKQQLYKSVAVASLIDRVEEVPLICQILSLSSSTANSRLSSTYPIDGLFPLSETSPDDRYNRVCYAKSIARESMSRALLAQKKPKVDLYCTPGKTVASSIPLRQIILETPTVTLSKTLMKISDDAEVVPNQIIASTRPIIKKLFMGSADQNDVEFFPVTEDDPRSLLIVNSHLCASYTNHASAEIDSMCASDKSFVHAAPIDTSFPTTAVTLPLLIPIDTKDASIMIPSEDSSNEQSIVTLGAEMADAALKTTPKNTLTSIPMTFVGATSANAVEVDGNFHGSIYLGGILYTQVMSSVTTSLSHELLDSDGGADIFNDVLICTLPSPDAAITGKIATSVDIKQTLGEANSIKSYTSVSDVLNSTCGISVPICGTSVPNTTTAKISCLISRSTDDVKDEAKAVTDQEHRSIVGKATATEGPYLTTDIEFTLSAETEESTNVLTTIASLSDRRPPQLFTIDSAAVALKIDKITAKTDTSPIIVDDIGGTFKGIKHINKDLFSKSVATTSTGTIFDTDSHLNLDYRIDAQPVTPISITEDFSVHCDSSIMNNFVGANTDSDIELPPSIIMPIFDGAYDAAIFRISDSATEYLPTEDTTTVDTAIMPQVTVSMNSTNTPESIGLIENLVADSLTHLTHIVQDNKEYHNSSSVEASLQSNESLNIGLLETEKIADNATAVNRILSMTSPAADQAVRFRGSHLWSTFAVKQESDINEETRFDTPRILRKRRFGLIDNVSYNNTSHISLMEKSVQNLSGNILPEKNFNDCPRDLQGPAIGSLNTVENFLGTSSSATERPISWFTSEKSASKVVTVENLKGISRNTNDVSWFDCYSCNSYFHSESLTRRTNNQSSNVSTAAAVLDDEDLKSPPNIVDKDEWTPINIAPVSESISDDLHDGTQSNELFSMISISNIKVKDELSDDYSSQKKVQCNKETGVNMYEHLLPHNGILPNELNKDKVSSILRNNPYYIAPQQPNCILESNDHATMNNRIYTNKSPQIIDVGSRQLKKSVKFAPNTKLNWSDPNLWIWKMKYGSNKSNRNDVAYYQNNNSGDDVSRDVEDTSFSSATSQGQTTVSNIKYDTDSRAIPLEELPPIFVKRKKVRYDESDTHHEFNESFDEKSGSVDLRDNLLIEVRSRGNKNNQVIEQKIVEGHSYSHCASSDDQEQPLGMYMKLEEIEDRLEINVSQGCDKSLYTTTFNEDDPHPQQLISYDLEKVASTVIPMKIRKNVCHSNEDKVIDGNVGVTFLSDYSNAIPSTSAPFYSPFDNSSYPDPFPIKTISSVTKLLNRIDNGDKINQKVNNDHKRNQEDSNTTFQPTDDTLNLIRGQFVGLGSGSTYNSMEATPYVDSTKSNFGVDRKDVLIVSEANWTLPAVHLTPSEKIWTTSSVRPLLYVPDYKGYRGGYEEEKKRDVTKSSELMDEHYQNKLYRTVEEVGNEIERSECELKRSGKSDRIEADAEEYLDVADTEHWDLMEENNNNNNNNNKNNDIIILIIIIIDTGYSKRIITIIIKRIKVKRPR